MFKLLKRLTGTKPANVCEHEARHDTITKEVEQSFNILQSMVTETTNIAHDVSTKLESRFAATQRKLVAVLNGVSDGIVIVDMGGKIHEWNTGAEQITGLLRNEVLCRPFCELNIVPEPLVETSSKGLNTRYKNSRDEVLDLNVVCTEFRDVVDGDPGRVLVIRDHTASRRERLQIERERDVIRDIMDAVSDAVIVKDEQLAWVHINIAARKLLEHLVGDRVYTMTPQEIYRELKETNTLKPQWSLVDQRSVEEGIEIVTDEVITNSQKRKVYEVQRTPFTTSTKDVMLINVVRDVTDSRQNQTQVRTVMRALDETSDAVAVIDKNGTIEYVNNRMRSIYPGMLTSQTFTRYVAPVSKTTLKLVIDKVVGGEVWRGFLSCVVDGKVRMMHTNIVPVANIDAEVDRYIVFQTDVGEMRL